MVYQESVKENHDYINGLIMIALIIICPPIGIILALFCLYKGSPISIQRHMLREN